MIIFSTIVMVDIKHTRLNHTVVHLRDSDIKNFAEIYSDKAKTAPKFFQDANILLDPSALTRNISLESIQRIKETINQSGAHVIGVINTSQDQHQAFAQASIPSVNTRKDTHLLQENTSYTQNIMVKDMVRSGMQVYAQKQTLIIQGNVGRGAEVIADGHVICLGKLDGKVIAGASGDTSCQIMASKFKPELVSIAGVYELNDDIDSKYLNTSTCVAIVNGEIVYSSNSTSALLHG